MTGKTFTPDLESLQDKRSFHLFIHKVGVRYWMLVGMRWAGGGGKERKGGKGRDEGE